MTRISFLNGQFIDHDKAFIHIEDRGFQFADGVYEVILFRGNKLIDAVPHLDRLFRSLNEINIKHNFSQDEIIKNTLELFKRNNLSDGFVYMQYTRGATNRTPNCPQGLIPTVVMTVCPAKIFTREDFEKGLSLMSHEDIRWQRCDIKTVGLLASTLINQKAKDLGFDDALFVRSGVVTEGTYSNFFIVDADDNLITKSADNHILQGITRNRIIDLAKKNNIKVVEKNFGLDEVFKAKEAFLLSSTLAVRPVVKLDNKAIGNGKAGKISAKLNVLYQEFMA